MKKLRGNPGKRALNAAEPQPPTGVPAMPEGLPLEAQQEWNRIVPELLQLGVLTVIDGKALAAYCVCYSRWMEAERLIEKIGLIVVEKVVIGDVEVGKKVRRNPAVPIANEAMKCMKSFLVEFGMTPAARSRIRVDGSGKSEDPLDSYLQSGQKPDATIN